MSFLKDLQKFISKYYEKHIIESGFHFVNESDGPGMGAIMEFNNEEIKLQFINDRGQYFVSIGMKELWDLDLIMALFYLNDLKNESNNKTSRKEILLNICNWNNYKTVSDLSSSHISEIIKLFLNNSIDSFEKELKMLNKERVKYNWEN